MTQPSPTPNRWFIAGAGTLLQLCLGTIYAWSFFQQPMVQTYGWSNSQVAWVFSLAICFLGLAAAWGGMNLGRFGPRKLAVAGGMLFGGGNLLAAVALHFQSLPLLYLGYGVIGGTGLGLGYVTPVATAARWFPDKQGLVTGMVIMGFGLGALLMSKILAPALMSATGGDLVMVFAILGVFFLPVTVGAGFVLRNPPEAKGSGGQVDGRAGSGAKALPAARESLLSLRFALIWVMFFCNIAAGIAIIAFQSPMLQDLLKRTGGPFTPAALAGYGATLIAASSAFNGFGRLFWGGVSDHIGRGTTFRLLLGTQVVVFLLLARVSQPWVFAALVCYILLCYGGGFGTMPSLVLDTFGAERLAVVYGSILTAWSAAGIAGPQVLAWLKDHHPQDAAPLACYTSAAVLALGLLVSSAVRIGDR